MGNSAFSTKRISAALSGSVTLFALLLFVCPPAKAQFGKVKEQKAALQAELKELQRAAEVSDQLYLLPDVDREKQSFLLAHPNIVLDTKDGLSFDSRKIAMIPPGTYTFGARYEDVMKLPSTGHSVSSGNVSVGMSYAGSAKTSSARVDVHAVLEPGKFYRYEHGTKRTVSLRSDNVIISIIEETDQDVIGDILDNAEKNRAAVIEYLQWSEANPGVLEGAYVSKRRKGKLELVFSGDRFSYTTPQWKYEGTFRYDHNTIIMHAEKRIFQGHTELFHDGTDIMYYELRDGQLHIGQKLGTAVPLNMFGEYTAKMP